MRIKNLSGYSSIDQGRNQRNSFRKTRIFYQVKNEDT